MNLNDNALPDAIRALRMLRESLRISPAWLAGQLGVYESDILRLESGQDDTGQLLPQAQAYLDSLQDLFQQRLADLFGQVSQMIEEKGSLPEVVTLLRYGGDLEWWYFDPAAKPLPNNFHNAYLDEARRKLANVGLRCRVVDMDRRAYLDWLNGRPDSTDMRAQWAALQPSPGLTDHV